MISLIAVRTGKKQGQIRSILLCGLLMMLIACACTPTASPIHPTVTAKPNLSDGMQPTFTPEPSIQSVIPEERDSTPLAPSPIGSWKSSPIIPKLSQRAKKIYQQGLDAGTNPRAFSKVGDGEIASRWFLSIFDSDPANYVLGPYPPLADTIAYFAGSHSRDSLAARAGFNTTRILDPLYAMNDTCDEEESPLECELRLHRPGFAIISLGTNQIWTPEIFETELRKMVEICIAEGVVPILSTKGDNLEGDHRINAIIAEIAREFDVPLWNFWLAIQSLPDQGLQPDGEHLTWAKNDFGDPEAMQHAWPVRNLTALQVLDQLIRQLGDP